MPAPDRHHRAAVLQGMLFAACWSAAAAIAQPVTQAGARPSPPAEAVTSLQRTAETLLLRARVNPDVNDALQAEAVIRRALRLDKTSAKSWELRAWSEINRHRFREALATLARAKSHASPSAVGLALEADALVELGRYEEALAAVQTLMDRSPGMPAYSRAAHLRFLFGDTEGAIRLMRVAVQAGRPRSEETAWVLLQLSELYLRDSQLAAAEQAALAADATYPGLAASSAQMGRVRAAQDRLVEALEAYKQAQKRQPRPEYAIAAYHLARRLNRTAEARYQLGLVNALALLDQATGGMEGRAFALFFADQPGQTAKAERLARADWRTRPDIYGDAVLAWALYRNGKADIARQHAERALRLGTRDTELTERAATILAAASQARGEGLVQARDALPTEAP